MAISVLYVINSLDIGGAERHVAQIARALGRRRVEPAIYTLTAAGMQAPMLRAAGITIFEPPLARWLGRRGALGLALLLPLSFLRLVLLLRARRPAVVHCYLPMAYMLGMLAAVCAGVRLRVMSRRSLNRYQEKHIWARPVERFLFRYTTAILGNSRAVLDELRKEGTPADRLGLIYNGIDPAPFEAARADPIAARRDLGLADGVLVLVLVANLIGYKGHRDLLQALARAAPEMPAGWRLLCAGRDLGIGAALKAETERLGLADNVRWLGPREDVPRLLAAADIGLLVSHEEGFSNAILEGMAASLPMIVTDAGGNAEAVEDGTTGLVVPPRDSPALARAILRLARDSATRMQMGRAGRTRLEQRFSLDRCIAGYEALYQGLVTGAGIQQLRRHSEDHKVGSN